MPAGSCPDENVLSAYAERRLAEAERAKVEAHIDACAECLAVACEAARGGDADGEPVGSGSTVGRYTLVEMIGQGAMGSVFLAHDPQLDRKVALKLVRGDRLAAKDGRARLLREARAMAKLAHRNVVVVHDAGEVDERVFVAMEYVEGETLAAWLRARARTWREVLRAFLAAGEGLAAAHAAGIVHRDFKPENVLVDREGRVAVTDFGLAAAPGGDAPDGEEIPVPSDDALHALTRTGALLGTPSYMSPEQLTGARVDARTDQFSFGVSLYEALFGERPFPGATIGELRDAVTRGEIRPAPAASSVPAPVRRALLRALATRPEDRYARLADLLAALDRAAAPAWKRAGYALGSRAARRALGIAALALAAAGAAVWARPRPAPMMPTPEHPAAVLVLSIENKTADPVFDGTLEAAYKRAIGFSPLLDAYARSTLHTLARDVDPKAPEIDERLGQKLLARDGGRVVTMRGAIDARGAGYVLSVVVKDARDGSIVVSASRVAPDASRVIPELGRLSWQVRAAFGETPPDDPAVLEETGMSASLEADHEYSVGHDLSAAGKRSEAIAHLERAVEIDPTFARAHWGLGGALDTMGQHADAEREYKVCLEPSARGLSEHEHDLFAGSYAMERGDYDDAAKLLERAVHRRPGDTTTLVHLGIVHNWRHEPAKSVDIGRRAKAAHPTHLYVRTDLAWWLLSAGDAASAEREARSVLAEFSHPLDVSYTTIAAAAALQGRRADALEALAKLRAHDASSADADLADLALFEGRLGDATAILEPAIAADLAQKKDESASAKRAMLAEVLLRRGDARGATEMARRAVEHGSRATAYAAGWIDIEAGGTGDAARAKLVPPDGDAPGQEARAFDALLAAEALRARGKPDDAVRAFEGAQRILASWPGRFGLARARLDAGDAAGAARELGACTELASGVAVVFPVEDRSSLRYLTRALYWRARALDAARDPGARAAYDALLAREPDAQGDAWADDARRRRAQR